ncbi:MAG: T9SS type A sorting domain-containing protein [Ignavibacteriaceae bacterium]|nr:T9SS type A sorting domain-containing protein [Ignavibacteriaceae bacterium]
MKNFILVIIMLLATGTKLIAQWSTDPNNNLIVGYGLDPHICSDSAGGCYITYDYHSTSYPRWLALERLDKYGYKPWGINKRILGESPDQSGAEIIEDGSGGVIISYIDRYENLPYWTQRVRVQKVDSNGNFLWEPTGVKITLDEINQGTQKIVSDGEGGAVIVWVNTLAEYKVNRISSEGQRMWGDSGIVAGINGYYDPPRLIRASDGNYYLEIREFIYKINSGGNIVRVDSVSLGYIVPDPEGGIVLSGRVWTGMIPKLVAQRKDSLGNNLWQEPYVEIADSLYINTQLRIQYSNSYYFYGWSGTKNGVNRIAQFQALRSDGSKLYPEGSIAISDNSPLSVAGIIQSDASKTIFIWNDDPNLPDSTLTQMYDTLGNKIWIENGVVVAHPAISYQTYTTDVYGGYIIGGIINEFTVVAQQVSKYGNLGEIITSVPQEHQEILPLETILYQNYPNPFNSSTIIRFQLPVASEINIDLYNVLGEKAQTIVNGFYSSGIHTINFSSCKLSSGIYLYKLKTETQSLTKKLLIIK